MYFIKRLIILLVLFVVSVGVLLTGCKERDFPRLVTIYNSQLQETKVIGFMDTVYISVQELDPQTAHTVTLKTAGGSIISQAVLTSDEEGNIAPTPMWYDVGLITNDSGGGTPGTVDKASLTVSSFTIDIVGGGTNMSLDEYIFIVMDEGIQDGQIVSTLPPNPVIWASGPDGKLSNTFSEDDNYACYWYPDDTDCQADSSARDTNTDEVWVSGLEFPFTSPETQIDVYVTVDNTWIVEDSLGSPEDILTRLVVGPVSVDVNPDGSLVTTLVWDVDIENPGVTNGSYDIVADVDGDGVFDIDFQGTNPPDAVDNMSVPGFILLNSVFNNNPGADPDNDGLMNFEEEEIGTDPVDWDTDDGGASDGWEVVYGRDPFNGDDDLDKDMDGLVDDDEAPNSVSACTNEDDPDTDGDGLSDGLEVNVMGTDPCLKDSDTDGLCDGIVTTDTCVGFDAGEDINTNGVVDVGETDPDDIDTDGDGLDDGVEVLTEGTNPLMPDTDGDGLEDGTEVNGTNPTNPLVADTDGDALLDGVEDANQNGSLDAGETDPNDEDTDDGGDPDGYELLVADPPTDPLVGADDTGQDQDNDGLTNGQEAALCTDSTDPDSDDDGLTDGQEVNDTSLGTHPCIADTDDDGLLDGTEVNGLNPTDPLNADTDSDGLFDGEEDENGDGARQVATEPDPNNADTDGDGLLDGSEDLNADGDVDVGETDPLDPDSDDDFLADGAEIELETDPNDADTDDDGILDGVEVNGINPTNPLDDDTDGDALLDGTEDANSSGHVDPGETNPNQYDTDGGGLSDGAEDTDHDGVLDVGETDPLDPTDDLQTPGDTPDHHIVIQIASSGCYQYTYYQGDWGYENVFYADGSNTCAGYEWWWGTGQGIKAVFNPYVTWESTYADNPPDLTAYSNQYVDIHVIEWQEATNLHTLDGLDLTGLDVTAAVETVPVQWGCANGLHLNNIWLPNFTQGVYNVVVDTNRNGVYDAGIDFVDGRRGEDLSGSYNPGFTVSQGGGNR